MSEVLLECFDRHARERPRDTALVVDGFAHTWGEVHEASRRSGDRLARELPHEGLVAVIGSSGAGAWIEITAALRAGRDVMLVPPKLPDRALASIAAAFTPDAIRSSGGTDGTAEAERLEAFVSAARTGTPHPGTTNDAAAPIDSSETPGGRLLLFSSGTTGRPRAIVRSAAALDRVAATLHALIDFGPRERVLSFLPMHHAYGLEHALLAPIFGGATVEQHATGAADAESLASLVVDRGATILPATPILLEALADAKEDIDVARTAGAGGAAGSGGRRKLHSLRRVYSAGSPLPDRVAARMHERWGVRVDDLYGASELGTITLSDDAGNRAAPGVELRIVDPDVVDALVDRATGEHGEVAVRSDAMFDGYADARGVAPLRERTIDGFFRTGDLGVIEPRGLRIVGRLKLQYDIGGLKVNAEEVERVLEEAPGVARAVVLPMAVTETLQRLRAFIEPKAGSAIDASTLAAFARERLAPHEVPRDFDVVERLPRTPSGKLLRGALMERDGAVR